MLVKLAITVLLSLTPPSSELPFAIYAAYTRFVLYENLHFTWASIFLTFREIKPEIYLNFS